MAPSLYKKTDYRDNCGFGLIAHQKGLSSHKLLQDAICALTSMTHRGAIASDGKTGDGCGLLIKMPDRFFRKKAPCSLPNLYAVGMIFFSHHTTSQAYTKKQLSVYLKKYSVKILGWRKVPVSDHCLGAIACASQPHIEQVFLAPSKCLSKKQFETNLFIARRKAEQHLVNEKNFHICSLSSNTISYKGLMMPGDLPHYYPDLNDRDFQTSICIFHQRFSTNTAPLWPLAQPFRLLAHNGEINTIKGNRHWAEARRSLLKSEQCPDLCTLAPLVCQEGSDSYSLDNMLELLFHGGMDIFHSLRLLIQPAWNNMFKMSSELKAFYNFNSIHSEPWDGPAGIVVTEGRYAICALDRNGLRPARWLLTRDDHLTIASEAGVINYDDKAIIARGRIGAGEIFALDTETGKIYQKYDIDNTLQQNYDYKVWIKNHVKTMSTNPKLEASLSQHYILPNALATWEKMFLVTTEEKQTIIYPLVQNAQEPSGSMGDDIPLAVMSQRVRSPYDYFRQQFAQVTNPPIDALRETLVMSLEVELGHLQNPFAEKEQAGVNIKLSSPILSISKYYALIKQHQSCHLKHQTFHLQYPTDSSLDKAIKKLCLQVEHAVKNGVSLVHLTDSHISPKTLPIHAVFAVGAIHQHLIDKQLRGYTSIIIETATARDPHHFAVLLGFGASAIYPYLAYALINNMVISNHIKKSVTSACLHYRKAIRKGLLKIMSKMGISTISSYQGAQLFEAIGLSRTLLSLCFRHLRSPIGGATFTDFHEEQKQLAIAAWQAQRPLASGGLLKYMHKGEYHAFNPDIVQTLQQAAASGDPALYQQYSQQVNEREPAMLRDLLILKPAVKALSIDCVESATHILKRFDSAAMSLGALSPEAHESLAQAMNSIGGRSNSGEGGEDPVRFGTDKVSKIKQVASGRFGVNAHYLMNAEILQIKIAQGAKPGEGGQLPGKKVNKLIARLRFSEPGVTLISPPPHHDIYSIEDLAQLIFDLKSINPNAKVAVKLVAGPGIGTIAAGVAKAYADIITIAGHDGGTGASPLSSIRYAGSPWEIGLAETQQALVSNGLRDKVILQADGGLKTGLDVVKAALLGADSFGFGTAPMIALGCKYLRCCHLNNCATGIATQNLHLRQNYYAGTAEKTINFFNFVAEEVRHWLAILGFKNFQDIIGRTDLLKQQPGITKKQTQLDFTAMLGDTATVTTRARAYGYKKNTPHDQGHLAEKIVKDCLDAFGNKLSRRFHYTITNSDRSIGARLSGEIAHMYGNQGMSETPIEIFFKGSAGQSFGVWNVGGLYLYLKGEANDYVGKGMTGGKLVITPPDSLNTTSQPSVICGNTCLYGATGGKCFIAGIAGERFAVRNSGAYTVVEGVGNHCCEYMTRGCVTVLGHTGHNFGAGMTGGMAYVLDIDQSFVDCYNHSSIEIKRISTEEMEEPRLHLYSILCEHIEETDSQWSREIHENFNDYIECFWLVTPKAISFEALMSQIHGRPE